MGQDALPLDDERPRSTRHGAARAAVERSLAAWRKAGHLVGPEHAALARVLRDSADAVDAAARAMHTAERCPACGAPAPSWVKGGTPGSLAYANNIHAQLVRDSQPQAAAAADDDPYGGSNGDDGFTIPAEWLGGASAVDPAEGVAD